MDECITRFSIAFHTVEVSSDTPWVVHLRAAVEALREEEGDYAAEIVAALAHQWAHDAYAERTAREFHPPVAPRPNSRVPFKASERTAILERDAYRCVLCGSHRKLHVDHIIPVCKGGTNDRANLRTLCSRCNIAKGGK